MNSCWDGQSFRGIEEPHEDMKGVLSRWVRSKFD